MISHKSATKFGNNAAAILVVELGDVPAACGYWCDIAQRLISSESASWTVCIILNHYLHGKHDARPN